MLVWLLLWLPAFLRDVKLESAYPSDLRNRQVGARLIADGRLPCFYKWQPADGMRYFDIKNCNDHAVSNITATPFLHELIIPFCNMPFRQFSRVWLFAQYALLLLALVLACCLFRQRQQRVMIVLVGILFPYTEAWKTHISVGQYYLLIPVALILCYVLLQQRKAYAYIGFAVVGISLVLIRPIAGVFFLPLLLCYQQYKVHLRWLIIAGLLSIIIIVALPFQRALWIDYYHGVQEQIKAHQGLPIATVPYTPCPDYRDIEGFNLDETMRNAQQAGFVYTETGNVHVLYEMALHKSMPLTVITLLPFLLTAIAMLLYYRSHHRQRSYNVYNAALLGFCLLMFFDVCAPVTRHQYNTVQWLFPLLLLAAKPRPLSIWTILVWLGLLLNIANFPWMKMEHTIGEYLMLLGLLALSLRNKTSPAAAL